MHDFLSIKRVSFIAKCVHGFSFRVVRIFDSPYSIFHLWLNNEIILSNFSWAIGEDSLKFELTEIYKHNEFVKNDMSIA